jgi:hypothetical protein
MNTFFSNFWFEKVGVGLPKHPSEFAPSLKHLLVKTYLVCMFWLYLFSWQKIQI